MKEQALEEILSSYWTVIAGLVAALFWAGRVEAGMLQNRKDIKRMEEQRRDDIQEAHKHRDKVDTKLDHISDDVNRVLVLLGNKADRQ